MTVRILDYGHSYFRRFLSDVMYGRTGLSIDGHLRYKILDYSRYSTKMKMQMAMPSWW